MTCQLRFRIFLEISLQRPLMILVHSPVVTLQLLLMWFFWLVLAFISSFNFESDQSRRIRLFSSYSPLPLPSSPQTFSSPSSSSSPTNILITIIITSHHHHLRGSEAPDAGLLPLVLLLLDGGRHHAAQWTLAVHYPSIHYSFALFAVILYIWPISSLTGGRD